MVSGGKVSKYYSITVPHCLFRTLLINAEYFSGNVYMSCSDDLVLRSMSHFVSFRIKAVSSVYGVSMRLFCSFGFIIFVCLCMFLPLCFGLCCCLLCAAFGVIKNN